MTEKPIGYSIPGMRGISPRKHLFYKTIDGANLLADLYLPNGEPRAARIPVIILIHGAVPPSGHHGFDLIDDDDTSRAIIKEAVDFMKAHLQRRISG